MRGATSAPAGLSPGGGGGSPGAPGPDSPGGAGPQSPGAATTDSAAESVEVLDEDDEEEEFLSLQPPPLDGAMFGLTAITPPQVSGVRCLHGSRVESQLALNVEF